LRGAISFSKLLLRCGFLRACDICWGQWFIHGLWSRWSYLFLG
jgi:hypothetical protein